MNKTEEITTGNYIGESQNLLKRYPNRVKICSFCGISYFLSLKKTLSKAKYCSRKCSDKNPYKGHWNKGRKLSEEQKKKISEDNKGEKSNFWKGGITPINIIIRSSREMKLWRKAVFERDDYTCVICKARGVYLEADHIKQFSKYPELRFELSNGRTLCRECHKKTDTYLIKGRWNK